MFETSTICEQKNTRWQTNGGGLKGSKLAGQDEHPLEPDTRPAGVSADKLIFSLIF